MFDSAILGGLLGSVARFAPEVLKFFDRKNERTHELALGEQQFKLVQTQGNTKLAADTISATSAEMIAGVGAIKAAYENMKSGIAWIDGLNALVRPWITFMIFHAWVAVKVAAFVQLFDQSLSWSVAIQAMWTDNDVAMLSGVVNFYFLGRVFEKKR
jgi:hypothetical protein